MSGVDKAYVNRVIHEMSKGSAFLKHATEQDSKCDDRIAEMKAKLISLDSAARSRLTKSSISLELELESKRISSRPCVVIDMDAFFAAVEIKDQPALANLPMAVGGSAMISTANYEARKYGVRSAMPGFIAKQLCPALIFVEPHFDKYEAASKDVFEVLRQYDAHTRMMSLDEAKLDLTAYLAAAGKNLDDVEQIVQEIRERVLSKTGLTCSGGIGPNFMVAKIASDINKPNGQYHVPFSREGILKFLGPISTRKVGGIGKVTERVLKEVLEVDNISQLYAKRIEVLHVFTKKTAAFLFRVGLAIDHDDEMEVHHR